MSSTRNDDKTDLSEFDLEYQTFLDLAELEAEQEADDETDGDGEPEHDHWKGAADA